MTSAPALKRHDSYVSADEKFHSVGKILKQTRLEQKKSLQEVAERLRISQEYLGYLEESTLEGIVERVYILGFLRAYAEFLELNAKDLVNLYLREFSPQISSEAFIISSPVLDEGMPKKWVLLIAAVCFVVAALGWLCWTPRQDNSLQDAQADTLRLRQLEELTNAQNAPYTNPSKDL
ncbi:MAG: helix-turn-helix domain-containing protein [Pseudomonadota bacterium]